MRIVIETCGVNQRLFLRVFLLSTVSFCLVFDGFRAVATDRDYELRCDKLAILVNRVQHFLLSETESLQKNCGDSAQYGE